MKHRLFTTAAALSLLLCLACVFMWVRSNWTHDQVQKNLGGGSFVAVESAGGRVSVAAERLRPSLSYLKPQPWTWATYSASNSPFGVSRPGNLSWPEYSLRPLPACMVPGTSTRESLWLPYWLLTSLFAILPAFWFWRWRQAKKGARRRGFEVRPATEKK